MKIALNIRGECIIYFTNTKNHKSPIKKQVFPTNLSKFETNNYFYFPDGEKQKFHDVSIDFVLSFSIWFS